LLPKVRTIDPDSMIGSDFKSALQELLQAAGTTIPEYALAEASGPDHRRTFRVELRIGGAVVSSGEGSTIKLAQQGAARIALSESIRTWRLRSRRRSIPTANPSDRAENQL
jgi:ribonuclease-3